MYAHQTERNIETLHFRPYTGKILLTLIKLFKWSHSPGSFLFSLCHSTPVTSKTLRHMAIQFKHPCPFASLNAICHGWLESEPSKFGKDTQWTWPGPMSWRLNQPIWYTPPSLSHALKSGQIKPSGIKQSWWSRSPNEEAVGYLSLARVTVSQWEAILVDLLPSPCPSLSLPLLSAFAPVLFSISPRFWGIGSCHSSFI